MDRSGGLSPSLMAPGSFEALAMRTVVPLQRTLMRGEPQPPPRYAGLPRHSCGGRDRGSASWWRPTRLFLWIGLTGVGFLKTSENGRKTQKQDLPLLDRRGVRRTGWSIAHRARNRSVWLFFQRFQSTTAVPSCPGGELISPRQREKPTPVSSQEGTFLTPTGIIPLIFSTRTGIIPLTF